MCPGGTSTLNQCRQTLAGQVEHLQRHVVVVIPAVAVETVGRGHVQEAVQIQILQARSRLAACRGQLGPVDESALALVGVEAERLPVDQQIEVGIIVDVSEDGEVDEGAGQRAEARSVRDPARLHP